MDNRLLHGLQLHSDARDRDQRHLVEDVPLVLKRLKEIELEVLGVNVREVDGLELAHATAGLYRLVVRILEVKTADALELVAPGTELHLRRVVVWHVEQINLAGNLEFVTQQLQRLHSHRNLELQDYFLWVRWELLAAPALLPQAVDNVPIVLLDRPARVERVLRRVGDYLVLQSSQPGAVLHRPRRVVPLPSDPGDMLVVEDLLSCHL